MTKEQTPVVVTGLGFVTPIGTDRNTIWGHLKKATTAIRTLQDYPTYQGGARVENFEAESEVRPKRILKMINRATAFAIAAAQRAWDDACLMPGEVAPERFGIYVGSGESEMHPETFFPAIELARDEDGQLNLRQFAARGLDAIDPYVALTSLSNNALCYISIAHQLMGPSNNYVKSGVASSQALGEAMLAIRHGYADAIMVVGVDALTDPLALTAYNSVGLLTPECQNVADAMRPFDRDRNGFQPGEGAVALVLENQRLATRRNARIYGSILGFGQATDTFNIVSPPENGGQLPVAINRALEDAQLTGNEVAFIIAHGNATIQGDLSEANGIMAAHALPQTVAVTATKPITGHLGAASGATEAAFALLMLQHHIIPPIRNLLHPDMRFRLHFVKEDPQPISGHIGLHIARGIGGQNAVLVIAED